MTSRPLGYLAFAGIAFSIVLSQQAFAASAVVDANKEASQSDQQLATQQQQVIKQTGDGIGLGLIAMEKNAIKRGLQSDPIDQVSESLGSYMSATVAVDKTVNLLMATRLGHLERYKIQKRAAWQMDTSIPQNQPFDIFMRYFCDPDARSGSLKEKEFELENFNVAGKTQTYNVGCGTASGGVESRQSLLGTNDSSIEAQQIIGLPLKPELYFGTETFPAASKSAPSTTNPANTNRAQKLYEAAFYQSMLYILGEPPKQVTVTGTDITSYTSYIDARASVSRKMLASYPFAVLFAERTGTIDPAATKRISDLLREKMGVASENSDVALRLQKITKTDLLSVAEYKRIMMSDLMTSPGYYTRVQSLSVPELKREAVWLSSLLVALNYERNKWLEMQTALEAVNGAK